MVATDRVDRVMTPAEYHSHPAVSRSQLGWLYDSPEMFRAGMDGELTISSSTEKAFANGTAVHDVMAGIQGNVSIIPEDVLAKNGARSTNAFRRWKKDQRDDAVIIRECDLETIERQGESLREVLGQVIDLPNTVAEHPIIWNQRVDLGEDEERIVTVQCRCLPDLLWLRPGMGCVAIDWKTMAELPTERSFKRAVARGKYWLQDAHYTQGIKSLHGREVDQFIFACVRKSPPYEADLFVLDNDTRARSRERWGELIVDLAERREANNWKRYQGDRPITPVRVAYF